LSTRHFGTGAESVLGVRSVCTPLLLQAAQSPQATKLSGRLQCARGCHAVRVMLIIVSWLYWVLAVTMLLNRCSPHTRWQTVAFCRYLTVSVRW